MLSAGAGSCSRAQHAWEMAESAATKQETSENRERSLSSMSGLSPSRSKIDGPPEYHATKFGEKIRQRTSVANRDGIGEATLMNAMNFMSEAVTD